MRSTRPWRSSSSISCRTRSPVWPRWRRVTRPGGIVAACVWDHAGIQRPAAALLGRRAGVRPGCRRRIRPPRDPRRPPGRAVGRRRVARGRGDRTARPPSSTRPSMRGGSRSRAASAPPARISRASTMTAPRRCANGAGGGSHPSRSSSPPSRGRLAVAPSVDRRRVDQRRGSAVAASSRRAFIGQQSTARCASSRALPVNGLALQDRIAPIIERDQVRNQVATQPVAVAADPVDLEADVPI